MAPININGWQRIGVVFSAIWFVGVFGYIWHDSAKSANHFYDLESKICMETRSNFYHTSPEFENNKASAKVEAEFNACNDSATKTRHEVFAGYYAGLPLILGLDLVSVLFLWAFSWAIVATTRWVKRGFVTQQL